jgi:hypothetical protein
VRRAGARARASPPAVCPSAHTGLSDALVYPSGLICAARHPGTPRASHGAVGQRLGVRGSAVLCDIHSGDHVRPHERRRGLPAGSGCRPPSLSRGPRAVSDRFAGHLFMEDRLIEVSGEVVFLRSELINTLLGGTGPAAHACTTALSPIAVSGSELGQKKRSRRCTRRPTLALLHGCHGACCSVFACCMLQHAANNASKTCNRQPRRRCALRCVEARGID